MNTLRYERGGECIGIRRRRHGPCRSHRRRRDACRRRLLLPVFTEEPGRFTACMKGHDSNPHGEGRPSACFIAVLQNDADTGFRTSPTRSARRHASRRRAVFKVDLRSRSLRLRGPSGAFDHRPYGPAGPSIRSGRLARMSTERWMNTSLPPSSAMMKPKALGRIIPFHRTGQFRRRAGAARSAEALLARRGTALAAEAATGTAGATEALTLRAFFRSAVSALSTSVTCGPFWPCAVRTSSLVPGRNSS